MFLPLAYIGCCCRVGLVLGGALSARCLAPRFLCRHYSSWAPSVLLSSSLVPCARARPLSVSHRPRVLLSFFSESKQQTQSRALARSFAGLLPRTPLHRRSQSRASARSFAGIRPAPRHIGEVSRALVRAPSRGSRPAPRTHARKSPCP